MWVISRSRMPSQIDPFLIFLFYELCVLYPTALCETKIWVEIKERRLNSASEKKL